MPYLKDRYLRTIEQVMSHIAGQIYLPCGELNATAYLTDEPVPFKERYTGRKTLLCAGDKWANHTFDCGWFHIEGTVPDACNDQPTVLLLDLGGEGLVVDIHGDPVQGITCVASDFSYSLGMPGKPVVPWMEKGIPGEKIDLWVDAGANDLFGKLKTDGRVQRMQVAIWNNRLFQLYYDLVVLVDYLKCSNAKSARYNRILFDLYHASIQNDDYKALEKTAHELVSMAGGDPSLTFTAIGHAHIDLAWLWPIRETKRKGARTFATALFLMDRYPEYIFGASQPQLFQWMKEDYPALYERIRKKVKEGRMEPQGCMWVEADMNLAGGEALVRQILYGKAFFKQEFDVDIKTLWLPDVFGYNAALPQILLKSGNEAFMTQKLSWSQHNKFPHQTFRWKGIDGSEIFTHMLPEETYNSPLLPRSIRFAEENYFDSGICDEALALYGIGDGGGGPGMEHLEAAKRVKNLAGLCPVNQAWAQPMLLRLKDKTWDRLPVWAGELYLERHQGTYTTSANNKKMNRLMENALRELEWLCVLTGNHPKEVLENIWKEVLLYQFHDILPGSSINRVYDETRERYAALYEQVGTMIQDSMAHLSHGHGLTLFNSLSWPRTALVRRQDGYYRMTVPPMGYTNEMGEKVNVTVAAHPDVLENRYMRAVFNDQGALTSLLDKRTGRENIQSPSGLFSLWQESFSDCWDIALEYRDRQPEYFALDHQSFRVEGAEAICCQQFTFGKSQIKTRIALGEDDPYLTWECIVDWQESDLMLRTSFDTTILADRAGYDIQFGLLHRTNHENTLWDKAQFEVCAHKWVDLSEANGGLALLNDCKYGFRVKGSVMDMNILRAQHDPSELTDKGVHTLRYALYPHAGGEREGRVKETAYSFNMPIQFFQGDGAAPISRSLMQAENVIVEAVKPAEDGRGFILRAYEPYGTCADVAIHLDTTYAITPCDLMESPTGAAIHSDTISCTIKPFEICSWRLEKLP